MRVYAALLPKILSVTVLLTVAACSDADHSENSQSANPCTALTDTATTTTTKTWYGGVGAIFVKQCGSCHPGQRPTDYSSYSGVKSGITSEMQQINAGTMPTSGPLSAADKATLSDWVTAGMPEGTTAECAH